MESLKFVVANFRGYLLICWDDNNVRGYLLICWDVIQCMRRFQ